MDLRPPVGGVRRGDHANNIAQNARGALRVPFMAMVWSLPVVVTSKAAGTLRPCSFAAYVYSLRLGIEARHRSSA